MPRDPHSFIEHPRPGRAAAATLARRAAVRTGVVVAAVVLLLFGLEAVAIVLVHWSAGRQHG